MLYFDNRAGSKEFPALLPSIPTELYSFRDNGRIPGDCYFTGNGPDGGLTFGIEIKSLHDLATSIDTGRLLGDGVDESHGQLRRMLDYYDVSILLYYGDYFNDDGIIRYFTSSGAYLVGRILLKYKSGRGNFARWLTTFAKVLTLGPRRVYWHGLQAALSEIQLLGVQVYRVNDRQECATLIETLYKLYKKPWKDHKLCRTFNTSNSQRGRIARLDKLPHKIKVAAKFFNGLDNLGYERALAIANHFNGDIETAVRAIASNPNAVAGVKLPNGRSIGKVISNAVHNTVRSDSAPSTDSIADMLRGGGA